MNACHPFQELLSAQLDGELAPAEAARLQAHLEGCPACRLRQADLHRTVALIRSLEPVEPPPWLAERILARTATPVPVRGWLVTLARRPVFQATAALLLCVTGYLALRVGAPAGRGPLPQRPGPPSPATPAVPPAPEPRLKVRPHLQEERAQPAPEASTPAVSAGAVAPALVKPSGEDLRRSDSARQAAQEKAGPQAKAAAPPTLTYHLTAREPLLAPGRVQALLREAGATLLTLPAPDHPQLAARVPAEALPALLTRLEALGALEGPRPDPAGTGERVLLISW